MDVEQFKEIATNYCQLDPARLVIAGVSGGADSLCLLDTLLRAGFNVLAAHFDHQLRPGSQDDAEMVRKMAAQLGAGFVLGQGDVAAYARQERLSLEEAARWLRYHFLFDQARQNAAQAVAVGHTADDQVETLLMHLLRGTGLAGLAGMPYRAILPDWDARIPVVRPLLPFWREETVACCQERGFSPLQDETNRDPAFFRNRIRAELVPFLETFNPQARRLLWRTAQVLGGDAEIVREAVDAAWPGVFQERGEGYLALRGPALHAQPPGMQRALLRRAITTLDPALKDLDFAAVERALRYFQDSRSSGAAGRVDLVGGLCLWVEGETVWITGPEALPMQPGWPQLEGCRETALSLPGEVPLTGGWRLAGELLERSHAPARINAAAASEAWLDADHLPLPLTVRCQKPGDRFQPLGMDGHSIKLSDFWTNQKLPRRARAGWPLVTAGEVIVWVAGYRPAHPYRVTGQTQRVLHLRLFRD